MLEYVRDVLARLESDPDVKEREQAYARLRRELGLGDFGEVLLEMPHAAYPRLSSMLPPMASDEVQRNWTGDCGPALLLHTNAFVRSVAYNFARLAGRPLDGASILDFGCGYGRIARLMYYFTPEERLFGLDPWDRSIELCNQAGLSTNFHLSEYLPESLPVGDTRFDLIYALSVFTHLSPRAAVTCLRTLRRYVKRDGLLCITIRPVEYWHHDPHTTKEQKPAYVAAHRETGYAFFPHKRAAVDGDVTYGDATMTLEWLEANCPEWSIRATDHSVEDTFQRLVFMAPR